MVRLSACIGFEDAELSDRAFRINVAAWGVCAEKLTDGVITPPALRRLLSDTRGTKRHVAELTAARRWEAIDEGCFRIVGYLDVNPSRAYWERQRERWRNEQRRRRERRRGVIVAPESVADTSKEERARHLLERVRAQARPAEDRSIGRRSLKPSDSAVLHIV